MSDTRTCGERLTRSNADGTRGLLCPQPPMAGEDRCYYHGPRGKPRAERVRNGIQRGLASRANMPPPIRLRADGKGAKREGRYS